MLNIFQPRKHRTFGYTPRYYSEEKERLEELKKKYSSSGDAEDVADIKARLRRDLRAQRPSKNFKGVLSRKRLWLYFLVVVIILILFLK